MSGFIGDNSTGVWEDNTYKGGYSHGFEFYNSTTPVGKQPNPFSAIFVVSTKNKQ